MNDVYGKAVFAILMQNGVGIASKAPNYIKEKWALIEGMKHPENLLDKYNLELYNIWKETWKAHLTDE